MRLSASGIVLVAGSLLLPVVAQGAAYTVTDLGTLSGATSSAGFGINASGHVVGGGLIEPTGDAFLNNGTMRDLGVGTAYAINATDVVTGVSTSALIYHAFRYDSTAHDLGTLGGPYSYGYAINDAGTVAGVAAIKSSSSSTIYHAFVYDHSMHDLGTLGGAQSFGYGINNHGQVTGSADTVGNFSADVFLYDGTMHDLGTLGGHFGMGLAINNSGQVVGESNLANSDDHAFLYDGAMHDLGTLGGAGSSAQSINDSGVVVGGSYVSGDDLPHAFIYRSGQGRVDINLLIDPSTGWALQNATAINNSGQITGYGAIHGAMHAFLLTPIPEPSSFLLAGLGLASLVAWGWRRRKNA